MKNVSLKTLPAVETLTVCTENIIEEGMLHWEQLTEGKWFKCNVVRYGDFSTKVDLSWVSCGNNGPLKTPFSLELLFIKTATKLHFQLFSVLGFEVYKSRSSKQYKVAQKFEKKRRKYFTEISITSRFIRWKRRTEIEQRKCWNGANLLAFFCHRNIFQDESNVGSVRKIVSEQQPVVCTDTSLVSVLMS